jgi:hypothetical protein
MLLYHMAMSSILHYCTSVYEHHYKIFYIKIAIFLLFQLLDYLHPTTGYLDNRCYRELRSYLRHTEWQVGISMTFFFHFIYFLDFKFMSDLLHYKWEICIPNMTV